MNRHQGEGSTARQRATSVLAGFFAFVVAILISTTLSLGMGISSNDLAYAAIYPANDAAQVEDASDEAADQSGENATAVDAEDAEDDAEAIDEEETPMSSGLGGGEPIFSSFNFGPIAVVGIAAVLVFFFVLIRRTNGSIRDMNKMFK